MANITLTAAPLLGGYDKTTGKTRLCERDDLAMVSLAMPIRGKSALTKAIKAGFGLSMPSPVKTTTKGDARLMQTTPDQFMLIFPHATPDAAAHVAAKIDGAAYVTEQTDAWVRLELSGPGAMAALERICPLDLHESTFPVGSAGRTTMEHMSAVIIRTGKDSFLLLSASSSGMSFLHALETSLAYTSNQN